MPVKVGDRYGRLTVLELYKDDTKKGTARYRAKCLCDCGKIMLISRSNLSTGHTKSCGCLHIDATKKARDIRDQYAFDGTNILYLTKKLQKNNTSGVKGVCLYKKYNKWIASIGLNGKIIYLGWYSKKKDAIKARKRAEEEYFDPIIEEYKKEHINENTSEL